MNRVAWITGATGLIGAEIVRATPIEWRARGLSRAELDLTDFTAVQEAFTREKPQLVIHCAAMSKTLECERHPDQAKLNNIEVTRVLCELAADIPLLFFSTDLVFDGAKGNYNESDAPNPLTVYAETKVAAEQIVLANPKHTVIRTSLNGGRSPGKASSFTEQLIAVWQAGKVPKLFTDEYRSPILAHTTARAAWAFVARKAAGLFHVAGTERLSRFAIGMLVAALVPELSPEIERGSITEYSGPRRSPDTSLDCTKARTSLPFPLPRLSEAIKAREQWR